jgi:nucleotide-binding universal stress UspA family protein
MRILVAIGRDSECVDPVQAVISLPWPADALFTVLSVSEAVPAPTMLEAVPAAADWTEVQRKADIAAAEVATIAATQLKDNGLQAEGTSKQGEPKELIVAHANEWRADLIVVGSCQKSRLEKFILGSVSQHVVKHARCSVLVLKRELTGHI